MLAERWNWSHEEMMALPTEVRLAYLDEVVKMYEREKAEAEKLKAKSKK